MGGMNAPSLMLMDIERHAVLVHIRDEAQDDPSPESDRSDVHPKNLFLTTHHAVTSRPNGKSNGST
jgi:hypothetical protein